MSNTIAKQSYKSASERIDANKVDSKKSNRHKQRLRLVRRKTVIVRMRSDRIVKPVNVSKKTVIEFI